VPSRFYLGLAKAQHNDRAGAIQAWQALLADVPKDAPLHQLLVDRIAMLTAAGGGGPGGPPNPRAMVATLEARLKADPNDALGWVRLVRAWHVLGEDAKARAALAEARKTFAGNKDAQTAFDTAAKDLK
jgi:cytochrome c-type biogenesis protein CcmH